MFVDIRKRNNANLFLYLTGRKTKHYDLHFKNYVTNEEFQEKTKRILSFDDEKMMKRSVPNKEIEKTKASLLQLSPACPSQYGYAKMFMICSVCNYSGKYPLTFNVSI